VSASTTENIRTWGAAAPRPPFDALTTQPVAARFLSASVDAAYRSQAYLLTGPVGSGKAEAALLLTQALLCAGGGGDGCDDCRRVALGSHPDMGVLAPEGAAGYLTEQIHDLTRGSALAPVRATAKVYTISQADKMSVSFANAFLKLLEEPPPSVVFILIARSPEAVLPTIRSRCQAVPFYSMPEGQAVAMLAEESRQPTETARLALAYSSGSMAQARSYLGSEGMATLRRELMRCLRGIADFDALDVMEAARGLVTASRLLLDELRISQERQLAEAGQSLSRAAQASLEQRLKREMTAAERQSARWLVGGMGTWLRDILMVASGRPSDVVNHDESAAIARFAGLNGGGGEDDGHEALGRSGAAGLTLRLATCLAAVAEADAHLDYNVSVQSIFEFLLFTLREELKTEAGRT
jgi:DNA polymerase-3 subunit delta'